MSQYGHFVVSMPPVRSMASVLRRERSHALAGQMRLDPGGDRRHTRKPGAERIGPESGPLSIWLCHSLTALGLPASMPAMPRRRCCCSSTRATPTTPAAWLRSGWYREVADKSLDGQLVRAMITARAQLVALWVDLATRSFSSRLACWPARGWARPSPKRPDPRRSAARCC
jgi:hypothetical protein